MVELAEIDASLTRIGMAAAVTSSWPSSPVPAATDPDASVSSTRNSMTRSRQAKGLTGGRRPAHLRVMDADKLAAATARLARGQSPTQIATALEVSRATLYRHIAAARQS